MMAFMHAQRRDLTGTVGIVGIIVTIAASALASAGYIGDSIAELDERLRAVEQDVAVLQVQMSGLREDVTAIRDLLESNRP